MTGLDRLEVAAELGRALISGDEGAAMLVIDRSLRIVVIDGRAHGSLDRYGPIGRAVSDVIPAAAWDILEPLYRAALAGDAQSFSYDAVSEPSSHWVRLAPIRDGSDVAGS